MFPLISPPHPQSIYAQLPEGRPCERSVQTREVLVSTLRQWSPPRSTSRDCPTQARAFSPTLPPQESLLRSHLPPRASSGRQRHFKGVSAGVATCHRGRDAYSPARWLPRGSAHRGSWPQSPGQGHPVLISQTPLGPCTGPGNWVRSPPWSAQAPRSSESLPLLSTGSRAALHRPSSPLLKKKKKGRGSIV